MHNIFLVTLYNIFAVCLEHKNRKCQNLMQKDKKRIFKEKKNENKEAYLAKERERKRVAIQKRKNENSNAYKQYLEKERARKKDSYKNKKDANKSFVSGDADSSSISTSSTKYTVRSLSRTTNKTKSTLPTSPGKKVAVFSKLVHGLSPKSKNLVFKGIIKRAEPCKCDILLVSRIF